MNYADFSAKIIEENKKLKQVLAGSLILSTLSLVLILTQRRYFVTSNPEVFLDRPLTVDICRQGLLSIASNKLNRLFLIDEIYQQLKKVPYEMSVDEILFLKQIDPNKCKIIFKSSGKLLAFNIILQESSSYPFNYKLSGLIELDPSVQEEHSL